MKTATPTETRFAALAMLALPPDDSDSPANWGESPDLTVGIEHIPPQLRNCRPWHLLVLTYADEETAIVIGPRCVGVDATEITRTVFGADFVSWLDVSQAPRRKQEALAMLLIAAIREARATARASRVLRALAQGRR